MGARTDIPECVSQNRGQRLAHNAGFGMPSRQLSWAESAGVTAPDRALFAPSCLQSRNDARSTVGMAKEMAATDR
jgi:hypothetical protein